MEIALVLESWGHDVGLVLVSSEAALLVAGGVAERAQGRGTRARQLAPQPMTLLRSCSPQAALSTPGCSLTPRMPALPPPPQVIDTPRPEQVRAMQPDATEASEEDCLELMEMILGALGR